MWRECSTYYSHLAPLVNRHSGQNGSDLFDSKWLMYKTWVSLCMRVVVTQREIGVGPTGFLLRERRAPSTMASSEVFAVVRSGCSEIVYDTVCDVESARAA